MKSKKTPKQNRRGPIHSSAGLADTNAETRRKEAVRVLKKALNLADQHSTLTGDDEVVEIYDLIYDAIYVLNPKSPWLPPWK